MSLSDSRIGLTQTYTYNHAGRMATTSLNGSLRGTYKYNARHQLIRRVVTNSGTGNDGATHYVHDLAGNIIAEIDDTGATVREYIWLPDAGYAGLHLPLAVVSAAGTYYVHADHLSRPVRMTDAGKATVWSVTWDAWGNGIPTGPAALDARLPGQWFQIESGLHYNWHRQYDPSLGRYTQPDPLGFVDGPSVYGYGRGRPLEAVDPDGRVAQACLVPGLCPVVIKTVIEACTIAWIAVQQVQTTSPPKRCDAVLRGCKKGCTDIFVDDPESLPGTGKNYQPRVLLCVKNCMKAHNCPY